MNCSAVLTLLTDSLDGDTVDVSRDGVFLRGAARIRVVIEIEGKRCCGHLVRLMPLGSETTGYAIEFDSVDKSDPTGNKELMTDLDQWLSDADAQDTAKADVPAGVYERFISLR